MSHTGILCDPANPPAPLNGDTEAPSCQGSLDDGYVHLPLGDLHFPFMGRSENDLYISSNGYISFSGEQATDGATTIIPSHGAKPDDAIFVYWVRTQAHPPAIRRLIDPSVQAILYRCL